MLLTTLLGTAALTAVAERTVDRLQTEARGIHLLWSEGRPDQDEILRLPFIHGGQVVLQWSEIEPAPGVFEFKALDRKIAFFARQGMWATIQINGNHKPAWLFARVPHIAERLHQQVQDDRGTLMFWHQEFQAAHLEMLRNLAAHLRTSPDRSHLLGIRMNFNAVGTEQTAMPEKYRNPEAWIRPPGVSIRDVPKYSAAVVEDYETKVVNAYVQNFSDWMLVLVRNLVSGDLLESLRPKFESGQLALFHTSSEVEPRTSATQRRYGLFFDYARTGKTVAYAEPWASAWGEHGGKTDVRWCSACQWNYWTLLFNLHCGVSFIGEYYINLHFALTGDHPRQMKNTPHPREQAEEFMAAYKWADAYAGRHNRPEESPGAWVAFRHNTEIKAKNTIGPKDGWSLDRFSGDYNFLAERLAGDGSIGIGPIGPVEQRYGAFARQFPAGSVARIRISEQFVESLGDSQASIRVIFFDDRARAAADVRIGETRVGRLDFHGSRRWEGAEFTIPSGVLAAAPENFQVSVPAGDVPLILHLIEVRR